MDRLGRRRGGRHLTGAGGGLAYRSGLRAHRLYRPVHGQNVGFVKLYFPVFQLGAVFGKVIELSGFSKSIVSSVIRLLGPQRAMLSIGSCSGPIPRCIGSTQTRPC